MFSDPDSYSGSNGFRQIINVCSYIDNWSLFTNCVVSVDSIYSDSADSYVGYSYGYDNVSGTITINNNIMNTTMNWVCILY